MPTAPLPPDLARLAVRERTFTVDEYHALGRAGVLGEDSRVELIDGRLIAMSPIGEPHLLVVNRLNRLLAQRAYAAEPALAIVSVQNPLRLDDGTEPEPDLVLLRPESEGRGFPSAPDALLVVEVSDATLNFDRTVKVPRYAAAGVAELWVVAVAERTVEVHRRPSGRSYAETDRVGRGGALTVAALPALAPVPVDDVFGAL